MNGMRVGSNLVLCWGHESPNFLAVASSRVVNHLGPWKVTLRHPSSLSSSSSSEPASLAVRSAKAGERVREGVCMPAEREREVSRAFAIHLC